MDSNPSALPDDAEAKPSVAARPASSNEHEKPRRKKDDDDDSYRKADKKHSSSSRRHRRSSSKKHSRKRRRRDEDSSSTSESDYSSDSYYSSSDDSYSSYDDSSEEEERRRRRRRQKDKKRHRKYDDSKKKKKSKKKDKKSKSSKRRKDSKSSRRRDTSAASTTNEQPSATTTTPSFGQYGIIQLSDFPRMQRTFLVWLEQFKGVPNFRGPKWEQQEYFAQFCEDYNTATMPHEKYYNYDAWEQAEYDKLKKQSASNTTNTLLSDERQHALERQHAAQRAKEQERQALYATMNSEKVAEMKQQAALKAQLQMAFRTGDRAQIARLQERLGPDV